MTWIWIRKNGWWLLLNVVALTVWVVIVTQGSTDFNDSDTFDPLQQLFLILGAVSFAILLAGKTAVTFCPCRLNVQPNVLPSKIKVKWGDSQVLG